MNYVLKMPQKGITRLIEQHKPLLLLSFFPKYFNSNKDCFIIEIDETEKIFGFIRFGAIFSCKGFLKVWLENRKQIAWMDKSFFHFLFSRKRFYVYINSDYIERK